MPDWFCPNCGARLSYGVYCKTCKIEPGWEIRPASPEEIAARRLPPPPEYPRFAADD